jgi:Zn-dependent protease
LRSEVEPVLGRYCSVVLTYEGPGFLEYVVTGGSLERFFPEVYRELVGVGYQPILMRRDGQEIVRVFKVGVGGFSGATHYALAVATVAAIAFTGYLNSLSFLECLGETAGVVLPTVLFTISVLVPLALHELGHFLVSRTTGTPTPLPLFIPAPVISPLGTFGAVIAVRFLPRDRRTLALLGLSGPAVGTVASLIAMLATLRLSPALRPEELACPEVTPVGFVPMATYLAIRAGLVPVGEGEVVLLHPAALASMILLLIHFANLLPIGQLDGGHVVRSLTSMEVHRVVSLAVPAVLVVLAVLIPAYRWLGFFAVLAIVIGGLRPHVGYANQVSELTAGERTLYALLYALLLALTAPVPI